MILITKPNERPGLQNLQSEWLSPAAQNPIVDVVAKQLVCKQGETFKGSVTTVFETSEQLETHNLHSEFWRARVPTIEEYSILLSPQYFYLVSRGLGNTSDGVTGRNRVRVTEPRVELLRAMGARYVLTSRTYDSPKFPMKLYAAFQNSQGKIIRLYELENPNLGTFSPTHVVNVASAPEAMAYISAIDTKLDHDITLFEPVNGNLVPVEYSSMQFIDGGVRVVARSSGQSLVLLPLQFSNALIAKPTRGSVRLLRANIAQTALLFSSDIDVQIQLNFSIGQVAGRKKDIAEMALLNIGEDGSRRIDSILDSQLHPHRIFNLYHHENGN